jgi:G3E family GTPase
VRFIVTLDAVAMRTPVNVITGVLGAGKTTFITSLLANAKPADETWAVVVNDFGALGIDGALFDDAVGGGGSGTKAGEATDDKIIVRQVSGGCACCATAAPFTLAVAQVLRRYKPHRVLVEPSGMGDAGRVIDALRSEHLAQSVDVRATIAVVDVREFRRGGEGSGVRMGELWRKQCECADALVGSFGDCAADEEDENADAIEGFKEFGRSFWPKKAEVSVISERFPNGSVNADVLDVECGWTGRDADDANAANANPDAVQTSTSAGPFVMKPTLTPNGNPWMVKTTTDAFASCGYAFHVDDVFVRPLLKAFFDEFLLSRADIIRFKGIFRLGADWVRPDIVESNPRGGDGDSSSPSSRVIKFTSVAYRRDSRFELIRQRGVVADADEDEPAFWRDIANRLVAARKPPRGGASTG